jgi:large subunit ribosomal protein L29
MKNSEIIQFTTKELRERIEEERSHLVKLKLNHVVSPLDNPLKIKASRRNIARLLTELHNRTLNGKL